MSKEGVEIKVPACGIYRTGKPLPGHEEHVPAEMLVMFHNHSDAGPPIVLLPENNSHNRWRFSERGHLVEDEAFLAALQPLKAEGFYYLRQHFHPNDGQLVAERQLVQLGYNPVGEPIIFFPTQSDAANALTFPAQGMKIPPAVYELLEPLTLRGPYEPKTPHLH